MKKLLENWQGYVSDQEAASILVEEIWAGSLVNELVLLEHQQAMLEEGIGSFFKNAFNSVKGKIDDFVEWKDQKLMAFIDESIKKIQNFFNSMREVARKTSNKILLKLFPKNGIRKITDSLGVFRRPEYLKAGASILSIVLQKLAELGAKTVLDALTGGSATAAKVAEIVSKNIERIKMFLETVQSALDPKGVIDMLSQVQEFKEAAEMLLQLKSDLQNPNKEFERGFPALEESRSMKKLMENWRVWLEEPEPLLEYVVPMGYSLKAWKAHRKKHKITNAQWHRENPGRKWKVVHGHKKGEIGEPVNDKATNMSYEAANKMHAAIAISQGA